MRFLTPLFAGFIASAITFFATGRGTCSKCVRGFCLAFLVFVMGATVAGRTEYG
jgi:hypothetical protein